MERPTWWMANHLIPSLNFTTACTISNHLRIHFETARVYVCTYSSVPTRAHSPKICSHRGFGRIRTSRGGRVKVGTGFPYTRVFVIVVTRLLADDACCLRSGVAANRQAGVRIITRTETVSVRYSYGPFGRWRDGRRREIRTGRRRGRINELNRLRPFIVTNSRPAEYSPGRSLLRAPLFRRCPRRGFTVYRRTRGLKQRWPEAAGVIRLRRVTRAGTFPERLLLLRTTTRSIRKTVR